MVVKFLLSVFLSIFLISCSRGEIPEGKPYIVSDNMGAKNSIELKPTLKFTFNKKIDNQLKAKDIVFLFDQNGSRIETQTTINDKVLSITPKIVLEYDRNYKLLLKNIKDETGTYMGLVYDKSFKTTSFIKSTTPQNKSSDIGLFEKIYITFGSKIDPASLSATISGIGFSISSSDNQTFILTPTSGNKFDTSYEGLYPATTYTVSILGATDEYSKKLSNTYSFSFTTKEPDTTPPAILNITPQNNSSNNPINTVVKITFDEELYPLDKTNFSVKDENNVEVDFSLSYDEDNKTATLTFTKELDYAMTYTVLLKDIKDIFSNTINETSFSFSTSTILKATFPQNYSDNIELNTSIYAIFEGLPNFENAVLSMRDLNGNVIGGDINKTQNIISFKPNALLDYGTNYRVTITGVKDSFGTNLNEVSFSFRTKLDDVAPSVLNLTPLANSTVDINTKISATFDEPITGNVEFIVQDEDARSVDGYVNFNNSTITFTPQQALISGKRYSVSLIGVRDYNNNQSEPVYWSFETK